MTEKKRTDAERQDHDRAPDKAHSGGKPGKGKPGKIGETDIAPEHDPSMEKSGRREFGRDG